MRLLLVEDDEHLAAAVATILTEHRYAIDVAPDGQAAWGFVQSTDYDLIVLDVMLPKLDGISLCRKLRSHQYRMPILLLTALNDSVDKVLGLDAGADDYVVKPVDIQELVARIRALLRRGSMSLPPVLEWDGVLLNPNTCEVFYEGHALHLTPKEYALLELFLRHSARVFNYDTILNHLWSFEDPPSEGTVRAHIKGLRMKLKAAGAPADIIETVYGLGYRLKSLPEEDLLCETTTPSPAPPEEQADLRQAMPRPAVSSDRQRTLETVAKVWQKVRGKTLHRLVPIKQAIEALQQGTLSDRLRDNAHREAHKLAGSLGTFGFPEGSRLAQQLEQLLQMQPLPTPEQVHLATQWVIALEDHLQRSQMDTADRTNDRTNNPASPKQAPRIPCLLVVADNPILGEQLAAESSAWGIQIQFALNCRDAKRAIARDRLDVTVIDLHPSTHDTSETSPGLSLLADLSQPGSMPPMPILISCCNPSDRATAFRLGARMALPRFLSASQLLAFAWNTLHQEDRWHRNPTDRTAAHPQLFPTQNRRPLILMLGSDRAGLTSLGDRLQGWGVQVQITTTPLAFWQALNLSLPDLVVVADESAAGLDNFTLCRTLRQKGQASGIDLPILWIARNHDAIAVQQAFDAGATECICRPLVFEELVVRMFACLERIHLRWELAATNPLTHLPTPYTSSRDLSWFIRLSDRHRQPLCLGLVAIDRLRHIGERCGNQFSTSFSEPIDDPWECAAILRHMASLLQQAFRSEDVIGHWCNETFAIGLYGSTKADGMQRVARFLEVFSSSGANEVFDTPAGDSLQLTCSAGIAQYPEDGNHLQALHQAAAAALNRARMLGCDRVLPAE